MKKILQLALTSLTLLTLIACTSEIKPNVDVLFDLNGGNWTKDILSLTNPNHVLDITHKNDQDTFDFTLFDPLESGLRWHYKLFISFDQALNTYKVVYADPYKAAIENLDLPEYDYIIGVHYHNQTIDTSDSLKALFEFGINAPIIFDKDLITYESGNLSAAIYPNQPDTTSYQVKSDDLVLLPTPIKENFDFGGWYLGNDLITNFSKDLIKPTDTSLVFVAKWESYTESALDNYLSSFITSFITTDITLPTSYSGYELSWTSSHPEIISTSGKFHMAYKPTTVTLTAQIISNDQKSLTKTFEVQVSHKKVLSLGIASSYIYRDYQMVNDDFFETLDIINTAFIKADANGNLSGSAVLNNITTHIFPKSKIHGNWVLFSVAPESSWSLLSANAIAVDNFANNIVEMINTYGFDGVDIDWETPKSGEQTRYSNLMKKVFEKVKENNPNHLVTTAITGGQWQPPMYNLTVSNQYLDYINVMTYGMASNSGSYQNALYQRSGAHNTTYNVGRTPSTVSIDASVGIFNSYGVSNSKLIIGLAFYGMRQIKNLDTNTWVSAGSVYYPDIVNDYINNPLYDLIYDTQAGVPYILKKDGTVFISFDNPKSILEKSEYVLDNNLGGLMFWEYGTDTSGTLLNAMGNGLNK